MDTTVEYQGYTIQSAPQHIPELELWQLHIFISVDDHLGIRSREFYSAVLYKTKQEADIYGITFGQRLIDGKVEIRSVTDMKTTDRRMTPRLQVRSARRFRIVRCWKGQASCSICRQADAH